MNEDKDSLSQLCGLHPQQKFNATVRLKVQGLSPGLPSHQVFGRWLGQEPKDSSRSGADHCCCYGGKPIYLAVAERQPDPPVAMNIPPRSTAVPSPTASSTPSQRDGHIATIRDTGPLGWQTAVVYGRRSLAETAMFRVQDCHRARPTAAPPEYQCTLC